MESVSPQNVTKNARGGGGGGGGLVIELSVDDNINTVKSEQ